MGWLRVLLDPRVRSEHHVGMANVLLVTQRA